MITACGLPSISAVSLASFPPSAMSEPSASPPPVESTYGEVTQALLPLIGERFGGEGIVELESVGGEIWRLVRELEDESARDGLEWRDVSREDGARILKEGMERIP